MNTPCRFCGTQVNVPIPDDERMERFVRSLATRACCNRCADYHRGQRDRKDVLQKLALTFKYGGEQAAQARDGIVALVKLIVSRAEDFYLIDGLVKDCGDFSSAVIAEPEKAAWLCNEFEKRVVKIVSETRYAY